MLPAQRQVPTKPANVAVKAESGFAAGGPPPFLAAGLPVDLPAAFSAFAGEHDFHALLTAELADTAGWDLLVRVAEEFGDREARGEFKERHREEQEHVLFVRKVVERYVKRELQERPAPVTLL